MAKSKKKCDTIICKVCRTEHADQATRDESCKVLEAEKRIAHLYHNRGTAHAIRYAQADREEALGNTDKARTFRYEAVQLEQGKTWGQF